MSDSEIDKLMFYCGAQSTPDGDMLPGSFTVFPTIIEQEAAIMVIMAKIADEIAELQIESSDGMITFLGIKTWQQFADIEISDKIKMEALSTAIMSTFLDVMSHRSDTIAPIAGVFWLPKGD